MTSKKVSFEFEYILPNIRNKAQCGLKELYPDNENALFRLRYKMENISSLPMHICTS